LSTSPPGTSRSQSAAAPAGRRRARSWSWTPRPFARELPRFLGIFDNDHAVLQRRASVTRRLLGLADACAAIVALYLVGAIDGEPATAVTLVVAAAVVVAIHKMAGLYDRDDMVLRRSTLDELPLLLQLSALYGIIASTLDQAGSATSFRPVAVLGVWLLAFVLISVGRLTARAFARAVAPPERCLVVGDPGLITKVVEKVGQPGSGGRIVATLPWTAAAPHDTAASLGIESLIRMHNVQRVIISPATSDAADTVDLIRIAKEAGVRVSIVPRMFEAVGTSVEFEQVDGLTMLGVRRFGLTRSSRAIKRGFDLVAAALGLVATSPILLTAALAIRLECRGPIFFRQTRIGKDGRPFQIWKFRSMVVDAEEAKADIHHLNEAGHGLFKVSEDPRVTRVGRVLRKTSLDELPQLFNVLMGEMSLVGPRPLITEEDAQVVGHHRSRLHLTPGMTGPWQVLGPARVPLAEMVGIDYLYIANWSLWLDVKILLRTVPHVLASRGL
jgi:exopolysaccharide biosynthesis polyprenyl glycosylphosphotransferase